MPQFFPRIPSYRADAAERFSAIVERHVEFMAWVNHFQNAYFNQQSIPQWTLADDGGDPPHYPNAWRNPFAQITLTVPSAPQNDPQRGPQQSPPQTVDETRPIRMGRSRFIASVGRLPTGAHHLAPA